MLTTGNIMRKEEGISRMGEGGKRRREERRWRKKEGRGMKEQARRKKEEGGRKKEGGEEEEEEEDKLCASGCAFLLHGWCPSVMQNNPKTALSLIGQVFKRLGIHFAVPASKNSRRGATGCPVLRHG